MRDLSPVLGRAAILGFGLLLFTAESSHAQFDPDCVVGVELENAGIPKDGTVTLNLAGESPCIGNICPITYQPYSGDWNALVNPVARVSWEFQDGESNKVNIEGIGELTLPGQEGEVLTSDPGSFLSISSIISALSQNNGQLIITNKSENDFEDFSIVLGSETMCPCFLKAASTKVITWTNANGGDYWSGSNWAGGRAPKTDSTALFALGGQYTVSFSADASTDAMMAEGSGTVKLDLNDKTFTLERPDCDPVGIRVDDAVVEITNGNVRSDGNVDATGSGSILVNDAAVRVDANVFLGDGDGRGSMTISDSASVGVVTPNAVELGSDLNTKGGDLLIEKAGTMDAEASLTLSVRGGRGNDKSTATVKDSGSKLQTLLLVVGNRGEAELTVKDSGLVEASVLEIGLNDGGAGTVNVEGLGSKLLLQRGFGILNVGDSGSGFLNVRQGASLESGPTNDVNLGKDVNGRGRIVVRDSASAWTGGRVFLGIHDRGDIVVEKGGKVELASLLIGTQASPTSRGKVLVQNRGSTLRITGQGGVVVGGPGSGEVEVLDAGLMSTAGSVIVGVARTALSGTSSGSLIVSGRGSGLSVGRDLALGDSIAAASTVADTAQLDVFGTLAVGLAGTAQSRLEVITSALARTPILVVGGGNGIVRIRSKGVIDARRVIIGSSDSTSTGNIQIEDGGSKLKATDVVVGQNGHGILNTFSGGTAEIGTLTINNGVVTGNMTVQNMAPISLPKTAFGDSSLGAIFVDTLIVNPGAVIEADTVTLGPEGVVGGTGTIPFDITNTGTISPGDSPLSTGVFTVDASFSQTSTGILDIELGGLQPGDEHDVLTVSGTATLGGVLRISVLSGTVAPTGGDVYKVVSADVIVGTFDTIEPQEGLDVTVDYGDTDVTITVIAFTPVAIEDGATELPTQVRLHQNYPNPFSSTTVVGFDLPRSSVVQLTLYDVLGREKRVILSETRAAGSHTVEIDGSELSAGSYFYRLRVGDVIRTKSLHLTR